MGASELAASLREDLRSVERQLKILAEQGLIDDTASTHDGMCVRLRPAGYRALEVEDHEAPLGPRIVNTFTQSTIGTVFQGNTQDVTIHQEVKSGASLEQVFALIDQMVAIVRDAQGLSDADKRDYQLEAEALKTELQKTRRNASRVREMLATLSDTGGALSLMNVLLPVAQQLKSGIEVWLR